MLNTWMRVQETCLILLVIGMDVLNRVCCITWYKFSIGCIIIICPIIVCEWYYQNQKTWEKEMRLLWSSVAYLCISSAELICCLNLCEQYVSILRIFWTALSLWMICWRVIMWDKDCLQQQQMQMKCSNLIRYGFQGGFFFLSLSMERQHILSVTSSPNQMFFGNLISH